MYSITCFSYILVSSDEFSLGALLSSVKTILFKTFARKWSNFKCHPAAHHQHCCQTLVMDGCWKIFRQKCAYEDVVYTPPDLSQIWTGDVETPNRGSYYCVKPKDSELKIKVFVTVRNFKPGDIRVTKLCIYHVLIIFQSIACNINLFFISP